MRKPQCTPLVLALLLTASLLPAEFAQAQNRLKYPTSGVRITSTPTQPTDPNQPTDPSTEPGGSTGTPTLSAVSFGGVDVGTSSTLQATLTNDGSAALTLTAPTAGAVSGGDFSFVSSTCGASLAAGSACAIAVRFTPSAGASRSGSLNLSTAAGAVTASLSGTGLQAVASLSANTLAFTSQQRVGETSTPQSLTVTNTGNAPLSFGGVGISQGSADFAQSNDCANVAANASCTVNVNFTPSLAGTRTGVLSLAYLGSVSNVGLSGTGVTAPVALGTFTLPSLSATAAPVTLSAPSSSSDGQFTFASSNPAVASIAGNTLTVVGAGTTTITATQAPTDRYDGASASSTLTIAPATVTLGSFSLASKVATDAPTTLTAPSSNSPGTFSFASSNPAVATVSGNTLTVVGAGTTTVTATQAATAKFAQATTSTTLTVSKASANLRTFNVGTKVVTDAAFTVTAPLTDSDGTFTYTSSDANVATISGSTVTLVGGGTATISAAQAATGKYNAATINATLTVNKVAPVLGTFTVAGKTTGSSAFTLTPPSSTSTGTFSYSSSNTAVATISGSTVTIVGAGSSNITASQNATTKFNSATAVATLNVSQAYPSNYIVHNGLTYAPPDMGNRTWPNANNLCANGTMGGMTGWRLPSVAEMQSMYASYPLSTRSAMGWYTANTAVWTADNPGSGYYVVTATASASNRAGPYNPTNYNFNTVCVR